jgi:hypothetical protein
MPIDGLEVGNVRAFAGPVFSQGIFASFVLGYPFHHIQWLAHDQDSEKTGR